MHIVYVVHTCTTLIFKIRKKWYKLIISHFAELPLCHVTTQGKVVTYVSFEQEILATDSNFCMHVLGYIIAKWQPGFLSISITLVTATELHFFATVFPPLDHHPGQEIYRKEWKISWSALAEECKKKKGNIKLSWSETEGKAGKRQREKNKIKSISCLEERPTPKVQLC